MTPSTPIGPNENPTDAERKLERVQDPADGVTVEDVVLLEVAILEHVQGVEEPSTDEVAAELPWGVGTVRDVLDDHPKIERAGPESAAFGGRWTIREP